jgi:hypothetical protein
MPVPYYEEFYTIFEFHPWTTILTKEARDKINAHKAASATKESRWKIASLVCAGIIGGRYKHSYRDHSWPMVLQWQFIEADLDKFTTQFG